MRKWFRDYWQAVPIIVALILLAIALFVNTAGFQNLAWYGLVAITAIYAWATLMIVKENKRTVEEMRQARLDAVKPSLSLQPEGFTWSGSFNLYLMNSGGVAKDVKIDIEVTNPIDATNPHMKKALFIPAINREHKVYLDIDDVGEIHQFGGLVKVNVTFTDSYNQSLTDSLSIDFSELKKEGREIRGQYAELDEIKRVLERIEHKVKK